MTNYLITGKTIKGQRFKINTTNYIHAMGINLYNGSVWSIDQNGKKQLIKRINNV